MSSAGKPPKPKMDTPVPRLRLVSWKEIAGYLKRSPRTVSRWEREEGLPVRRHLHHKKETVYAFTDKIDAWLKGRVKHESAGHGRGTAASDRAPALAEISKREVPSGRPIMIAVLPLRNLSGNQAGEWFSDALTDEIISELGELNPQRIRVIPFASVEEYKRPGRSIDQIGRELGVDYVLEGSVRRYGRSVRVTARLTAARDEARIWGDSYEIRLPPLFALQQGLARQLVGALSARFQVTPTGGSRPRICSDQSAHDAYLAGIHHFGWSEAQVKKGIEHFTLAIERDADCAAAYAELSMAYCRLGVLYDYPPVAVVGRAKELSAKALTLDPGLSRVHAALGLYQLYGAWNWPEAEASSRRAIELNPSDSRAHLIRAATHLVMGRPDEAVDDLKRAHQVDPQSSSTDMGCAILGLLAQRYGLVEERCQEILRNDPSSALAHLLLGTCYARKGDKTRARTQFEKVRDLGSGQLLYAASLCSAYRMAGQWHAAERLFDQLVAAEKQQYVRYIFLAQASAGRREHDETLDWLEKAYEQHDPILVMLKCDLRFEPLSRSPRFRKLLERIGLTN